MTDHTEASASRRSELTMTFESTPCVSAPRTLGRAAAGAVEAVVVVASVCVLLWVAAYRFAMPAVDPAPPRPDYGLQAIVAYLGIAVVILLSVALTAHITRAPRVAMGRVFGVAAVLAIVTVVVAVLAFVASAR